MITCVTCTVFYACVQRVTAPIHEDIVQTLLFHLAEWHALAKLRLHTEDTLALLHQALCRLGAQVWRFQWVTCPAFETKEIPQESTQRHRREAVNYQSGRWRKPARTGLLPKSLNLNTYKFHALGDYKKTIRMFRTTDSYMTQVVSGCYIPLSMQKLDNTIIRVNKHTSVMLGLGRDKHRLNWS